MRRQAARVIFLVLFSASLSFAQAVPVSPGAAVPPVIRFSGTLAIAAGHVPVTFGLYSEETGGAPLWAETQTLLIDAAGRYQVLLGTTRTLPADVFASGDARWLDVTVEGLVPQPRRLLVSVPYAMKAADAETIGGKPLSAFVLAGEKTGVGADGLTYVDTRVLASGMAAGGSGVAGGAGTPNFIGVFTDTTTLGNSVIYQAPGGYLGMNTTAPQAAFHAVSWAAPVAYFDVFSNALTALPVVYRAARGTPASPMAVQANDILGGLAVRAYGATTWSTGRGQVMYKAAENWTDAAQGTYLQFTTTPIGSVTWAERIRIAPDGKVGIGTPTPAQMLSVAGTIQSTTGGFLFPDGTTQTTAARTVTGSSVAFGPETLSRVTSGTYNTAFGQQALGYTTTGGHNTANGAYALGANSTGQANTATGSSALASNQTGSFNTADGNLALYGNTIGLYNTAGGFSALRANTEGSWNAASGAWALGANTTGDYNTATGFQALYSNTTGAYNTATGRGALSGNTTGVYNVAVGSGALDSNTTGHRNVAIGQAAGANLTTGSYNIDIGHAGVAGEEYTVRIGTPGVQARTFIAGIRGQTTGSANAVAVLIDNSGQLGTASSSRRVKDDIADMAGTSSGLMNLRPVTFHYKSDRNPSGRTLQYGLIAEEVAEVYPGLVAHSSDGQIETVMYQFLPPMLLNEYQRQQRTIDAQAARLEAAANELKAENDALKAQLAAVFERLSRLEAEKR